MCCNIKKNDKLKGGEMKYLSDMKAKQKEKNETVGQVENKWLDGTYKVTYISNYIKWKWTKCSE